MSEKLSYMYRHRLFRYNFEMERDGYMKDLVLMRPTKQFEKEIEDYKQEFIQYGDNMDGTANLQNIDSITEWFEMNRKNESKITVKEGFVPATLLLAVRKSDNRLVGMIHIRHELNDYLEKFGGHIGYSVRKSERNKGYGCEILKQGLVYCKTLGVNPVLLTCDKTNIASTKIILSNNAVFESKMVDNNGNTILRYWITIH